MVLLCIRSSISPLKFPTYKDPNFGIWCMITRFVGFLNVGRGHHEVDFDSKWDHVTVVMSLIKALIIRRISVFINGEMHGVTEVWNGPCPGPGGEANLFGACTPMSFDKPHSVFYNTIALGSSWSGGGVIETKQ